MKKILATILSVILMMTIIPMAYAEEGNTYKVGDIIEFGSYPQSEVKDETLIAELNALAPEWDEWTSYGYYSGDGNYGSMVQGDFMRYADIICNGSKYRGVKFTQYRPRDTYDVSLTNYDTQQDDNGYSTNTAYWFKFEPIDWRILDTVTGLVFCETIIDSQAYSNTIYKNENASNWCYENFSDSSYTNIANDYETSSIREWLNNDFYNTAFTDSEKEEIYTTTLNNDGYYTSVGTKGYEALDSNPTDDKVFFLSYNEAINSNFGFDSNASAEDPARIGVGSDYANSQGLYINGSRYTSFWHMRSPGTYSHVCLHVSTAGKTTIIGGTYDTSVGVRPALRLSTIHQHTYTSEVTTEPTHTTVGVKTFTCECGDSYTEEIAKTEGHTYTSEATTEPTHTTVGVRTFTCECGDSYTEEIAKLEGHTYVSTVTAPTCTAQGFTTYTCACGDNYTVDYVNALGHKDTNGDYKCDNGCGYEFEKPVTPQNCTHLCHKSGFMGFIWKIVQFFCKLFKINPVCSCGAKHW